MSFVRFVPDVVRRRFLADPNPITSASGESYSAAVLFADIKGFTALTDRLAAAGNQGAEQLTVYLNRYFSELIQLVRAHGGEVVKFAGDALLAQWPTSDDLPGATRRAAAAALAIQRELYDFRVEEEVHLSMRLSLAAGELHGLHVGGVLGRWEFFVSGLPMKDLAAAQDLASPGQVVCSPGAWALLAERAEGDVLLGGFGRLRSFESVDVLPTPAAPSELDNEDLLRSFLPGSVLARLGAGQQDWLGELRPVSTLFVNLPDLAESTAADVGRAQRALELLQRALYRFEGSINKISVDDKGVSVVAAMGLPPLAHADDADRAVKAAVLARADLHRAGLRASIGVSTGTAFCGAIGDESRAEYTVMGESVNMAARLMQKADGGILVGRRTFNRARDTAGFEPLDPVLLKGKQAPVAVYRPTGQFIARAPSSGQLIGRLEERKLLTEAIQALVRARTGGRIVLEGDAGIGKSRLVTELLTWAVAVNARTVVGGGGSVERAVGWHAWRPVFSDLLGLEGAEAPEAAQAKVLAALDEEELRLAPLLSPVLPFELADNELTAQMLGVVRSDNTEAFLTRLLQRHALAEALVLVLEDAHWMDSLSWSLLARVAADVDSLLVVLSTRPLQAPAPEVWPRLLALPDVEHRIIRPLGTAAMLEVVCGGLGVASLPGPLADLIARRAEGNPYFSQELAASLRETGVLEVVAGTCLLPGGAKSLENLELPDTVQGLVNGRVDRLRPLHQLVLKVASVLGRTFSVRALKALYPVDADREQLEDALVELCEAGLLAPHVDGTPETQYAFRHALAQEAIYSLMLFSQRRDLHRAAAEWLEAEPSALPALLAHHWSKAEVWERAAPSLAAAGIAAVRESSNVEAVEFLSRALEVDAKHNLGHSALIRGGWEARIQDAWFAAGRLDEAREAAMRALRLLGHPLPSSTLGVAGAFFSSAIVRVVQSFLLAPFKARTAEQATALQEAAHVYRHLLEIFFYQNDPNRGLVAGFRSINLAERIEPGAVFARGFSMMAAVMDLFMMPAVGDRWGARALAAAEADGEHSTLSYTLSRLGVRAVTTADWPVADQHLERGLALSLELGEKRLWEETASIIGKSLQFRSRFAEADAAWREVTSAALARDAQQIIAWGQLSVAWNLIWLGRAAEAVEFMAPELDRSLNSEIDHDVLWAAGIHALASLEAGNVDVAKASMDRALEHMSTAQPYPYFMLPAVAATAQTCLVLAERASGPEQIELLKKAARAVKNLRFIGKFFAFARPFGHAAQGTLEQLRGKHARARKQWLAAISLGDELGMPLEAALGHLGLGEAGGPGAEDHLLAAATSFDSMGAVRLAARARSSD